ncbi:MAG: beta-lactamase family protein [Actinobacteria bacterium]|nr:beta-lactamase family protein [Actinomycetota bacterium]
MHNRLPGLLAEHQVPGAAIAVSVGGDVIDLAAGVLSKATGVEATADSVFQVGSITKLWTTTLVMQLADEGKLDIDAPVRRYLPEFRIADETAAAAITVRQLLCHTAGFEGDIFTDTGTGDDCVQKYAATLDTVQQLFAPGEMFSYNNAGFCVLGRVVEVLRGKPFDQCLREHICTPLGLTHVANGAHEAILFRAAVGHIRDDADAEPTPAPVWSLARSNAPAGSMLTMRPRDLLAFARMHASGGVAADGTSVLTASSVKAMQERQVKLPNLGMLGGSWGLGWEIFDWPGGTVIGHDGGTIGQAAFLRLVPDREVAIALLTNGGDAISVYTEIYSHLLRELAGIELPARPTPPAQPPSIDAQRYVGTYACDVAELTVSQDEDGRIWLEHVPKGVIAEFAGQVERNELVHLEGDTLISARSQHGIHQSHVFVGDDGSGRALYIHSGRATKRVTAP